MVADFVIMLVICDNVHLGAKNPKAPFGTAYSHQDETYLSHKNNSLHLIFCLTYLAALVRCRIAPWLSRR